MRGNFCSLLGLMKVHIGLCNCFIDSICIISERTLVDEKALATLVIFTTFEYLVLMRMVYSHQSEYNIKIENW